MEQEDVQKEVDVVDEVPEPVVLEGEDVFEVETTRVRLRVGVQVTESRPPSLLGHNPDVGDGGTSSVSKSQVTWIRVSDEDGRW